MLLGWQEAGVLCVGDIVHLSACTQSGVVVTVDETEQITVTWYEYYTVSLYFSLCMLNCVNQSRPCHDLQEKRHI